MNTRQQKVARQLQKDLGTIFQRRGMAEFSNAMITVSEVRMSPDLSYAKVFVSVFPSQKSEEVLKKVQSDTKALRGELGILVRHQLRIVPELQFYLDDTMDRLAHIDELLSK